MIFNSNIRDEEKLVLSLSNPYLTENHKNDIKSILLNNSRISPKKIYSLALANGVAGFIYKNSRALNIFPDKINLNLRNVYRQTAFRNILMFGKTLAVLKLLSDNKISAIPLKGATASDLLFNDFGVYPSGDIDILVHPSKLSESKRILCNHGGFSQIHEISEQDLLSNHYHLIFRKKNISLEVHWNLVKRYFSIPADFWWQESKEFEWDRINTFELSIERYILYNIFRLFDHCFYPLRFFILLGGIIHQNVDNINWSKLINFAAHYKMKKLVVFTLRLLKDMLNTNIPENLIQEKFLGYNSFKALVFSGIFSGIQRKHQRMMFYTLLLIESKILFNILVRRIFPSRGELRLRYNIPSKSNKIYLYYILNPLLLLFKKT
ncbi:MAG: nucleotidyltransferase family protein [Deltaproteobacteria bacterium]|nr:nucleotidyltransferase family protein [Deltaproteobacteria bacterium]